MVAVMIGTHHYHLPDRALDTAGETAVPHISARNFLDEHPQPVIIGIGAVLALITSVLGMALFCCAKRCRSRRQQSALSAQSRDIECKRQEMLRRSSNQKWGNVDVYVRRDEDSHWQGQCR
jgi:hypothetical protein